MIPVCICLSCMEFDSTSYIINTFLVLPFSLSFLSPFPSLSSSPTFSLSFLDYFCPSFFTFLLLTLFPSLSSPFPLSLLVYLSPSFSSYLLHSLFPFSHHAYLFTYLSSSQPCSSLSLSFLASLFLYPLFYQPILHLYPSLSVFSLRT